MANSKLVSYVWKGSKANCNARNHVIDTITPHHMAGNGTCEGCFRTLVSKVNDPGSVNYDIDSQGIIGIMIDENKRAWTTSSPENDHRAITIEVANDIPSNEGGWHVSDKAIEALIALCVDICKRYKKDKLIWCGSLQATNARKFSTNEMRMTIHKWFATTGCPGPYLESKMPFIAAEVTKRLTTQPTAFTGRAIATHGCYTYCSDKKGMPAVNGPFKKGDQWSIEKVETFAGREWGKIKDSDKWLMMTDVARITNTASNFRVKANQVCYTYASDKKGRPAVNGPFKKGDQWSIEKVETFADQTWGKIKGSSNWLRMTDVAKA